MQVQTEYASRPTPRITTTIIREGQVIQKIERNLDNPISSHDEQASTERVIQKQHIEICNILKANKKGKNEPEAANTSQAPVTDLSVLERIQSVAGVERIFRLDNDGNFIGAKPSKEFNSAFALVLSSLREILDIFVRIPGIGPTRETGVYEMERNSLYLISMGTEFYIVVTGFPGPEDGFERAFHSALHPLI